MIEVEVTVTATCSHCRARFVVGPAYMLFSGMSSQVASLLSPGGVYLERASALLQVVGDHWAHSCDRCAR